MKEIGLEELKIIQLNILTRVHEFCIAHSINYSLSSGTLIGAIRHKGYIPWDDDIDLYMLRPEYEKLERVFNDSYLKIMSPTTSKQCIYPYAKIYDSRTILVENLDNMLKGMGVNIDIFVIDSVPDNINARKIMFQKNSLLDKLIVLKTVRYRKGRGLIKNIGLLLGKMMLMPFPIRRVIKMKTNLVGTFNPNAKYICNVMQGGGIKACIPMKTMVDFIDVSFEGCTFKCMKDYDLYLHTCYGDYMTLPPVEKRVSHHSFKAWWK